MTDKKLSTGAKVAIGVGGVGAVGFGGWLLARTFKPEWFGPKTVGTIIIGDGAPGGAALPEGAPPEQIPLVRVDTIDHTPGEIITTIVDGGTQHARWRVGPDRRTLTRIELVPIPGAVGRPSPRTRPAGGAAPAPHAAPRGGPPPSGRPAPSAPSGPPPATPPGATPTSPAPTAQATPAAAPTPHHGHAGGSQAGANPASPLASLPPIPTAPGPAGDALKAATSALGSVPGAAGASPTKLLGAGFGAAEKALGGLTGGTASPFGAAESALSGITGGAGAGAGAGSGASPLGGIGDALSGLGDPGMSGVPGSYVLLVPTWLPPGVPFNPLNPQHDALRAQVSKARNAQYADQMPDLFWVTIGDGVARLGWYIDKSQPDHGATYFGAAGDHALQVPVITPAFGPNRRRTFGTPVDYHDWSRGIGEDTCAAIANPNADANQTLPSDGQ